jgi:hypothetical protein
MKKVNKTIMKKMWSINVFAKDQTGTYSKDVYGPKYRWSYDSLEEAKKAFDNIPNSEGKETLCELMEYSFETSELNCIEVKHSNHFASTFIIPGKYQHDIH